MKIVSAVFCSFIFLVLLATCVSMKSHDTGTGMGREASGLYSLTSVFTFIAAIPTFLLWYFILKERREEDIF